MSDGTGSRVWALLKYFILYIVVIPIAFATLIVIFKSKINGIEEGLFERIISQLPYFETLITYVPIIILTFVFMMSAKADFHNSGMRFSKKLLPHSIFLGFISGFIMFVIDILFKVTERYGLKALTLHDFLMYLVVFGFVAAFTEEFLFRGVMQSSFLEKFKTTFKFFGLKIHISVIIVAIYELLFHFVFLTMVVPFNPIYLGQLIYIFIFGVISCYIFQRTRSIIGPFLLHAIGNIVELLIIFAFI